MEATQAQKPEATIPASPSGFTLHSEGLDQIAAALSAAQGEIRNASRSSENPFFHSHYADLAAIWDACRGPLSKHGLSVTQIPTMLDGELFLVTKILHASGQWLEGHYPIRPMKEDPQAHGSAITYARRYSLAAMVCVCAEDDDDGNAASGHSREVPREPSAARSQISATQAARAVAAAAKRAGEFEAVHGFDVINDLLARGRLDPFQRGSKKPDVVAHLRRILPPDRFDGFVSAIEAWDPPAADVEREFVGGEP